MSNFITILEEAPELAEMILDDSIIDFLKNADEEEIQAVKDYLEYLEKNKLKVSAEEAVSESLIPYLEKNSILYGTFLYPTTSLQESISNYPFKNIIKVLRENTSPKFITHKFAKAIHALS